MPFQDDSQILEFLRTARILSQKPVGVGVNRISKVLLEQDGVQLHAAFRKVSISNTIGRHFETAGMIDHTRTFSRTKKLPNPQLIRWCRRDLWERLQELDREVLEEECKKVLTGSQIKALMARRDLLVEHIQKLIDERGEGKVLFSPF